MSSYTIFLCGKTSTLKSYLFPPLKLSKSRNWEAALLDFTTYNSIPNIIQGVNNKFHYRSGTDDKTVELDTGSYEIDDIGRVLQEKLGSGNISLKANNNLLKCEMISKFEVDFSKDSTVGSLLGFGKKKYQANTSHMSDNTVNIVKVEVINITCNIVQGAFKNGHDGHILHSFYPTVAPGFKIVEKPHNLIYLPLNVSLLSDIELSVTDQDGDIIDFRGEVITARIHIRSR